MQTTKVAETIAINDLETDKGRNQIGTLKHASDTRWDSHLSSLWSLVIILDATCSVLKNIIKDGNSFSQRNEVDRAYVIIIFF